ncbi:hypothetical protein H5407_05725 [Mitsuaria sp. WAJ17]|uniref:hypothetical protein n=1 Tax=Mitsuaria sp. WAJ17 TaxID=2761452 RepID=UPI0015FEBCCD|nr:hypothetical protein [Mitsuaria sp. WAJ17]MBB2484722.1 hypothetical protein [Mitsuaria sp. WAJ17]
MGSWDPRHLKASVAWSFPRQGGIPLVTAVAQRALRLLRRMVKMASCSMHALLAREGAMGVKGVGCGAHGLSVLSKG